MKKNFLFAALALTALAAQAAPQLQPAQSELLFAAKQLGVPIDGRFKRFDAQLTFDAKKPEADKVSFTVDMSSGTLGSAEFDAELVKNVWFDSKKTPQASFVSTAFKPVGPGRFEVSGKLTIKGQVHDVVVPVMLTQSGTGATAAGAVSIKRLDYKIGDGEWADTSVVANDVNIRFKLVFTGL